MKKTILQKAEEFAKEFPGFEDIAKQSWLAGYDAGKRSKICKKELDLSFVPEDFLPVMQRWINYKNERKQAYTQSGIEACYNKILELSNTNPSTAMLVVEQSIANNWAGLFELKNGTGKQLSISQNQSSGNRKESVERLADLSESVLQGFANILD